VNGIRYNDRSLVLGQTRSGKSELLNVIFSSFQAQRVLVDTKDEWAISGVPRVADVDAIDWRAPVIHFASERGDPAEFDELFDRAYRQRGPMVVAVHELGDLCDYQPNRTPPAFRRYLSMGAAHGLGLLGASQRPVEMPRRARTEAEHVFAVVPRLDPDDVAVVARMMNLPPERLGRDLDELQQAHGLHSFLWFDRRSRSLAGYQPLPASWRRRSIVQRRGPS
jgi:hypothetical protein